MDSGTNNPGGQDYTSEDEEKMDRASQAGVDGAFGADADGEKERETLREDAEEAFGGDQTSDK